MFSPNRTQPAAAMTDGDSSIQLSQSTIDRAA
jgi:hypothetical protein